MVKALVQALFLLGINFKNGLCNFLCLQFSLCIFNLNRVNLIVLDRLSVNAVPDNVRFLDEKLELLGLKLNLGQTRRGKMKINYSFYF